MLWSMRPYVNRLIVQIGRFWRFRGLNPFRNFTISEAILTTLSLFGFPITHQAPSSGTSSGTSRAIIVWHCLGSPRGINKLAVVSRLRRTAKNVIMATKRRNFRDCMSSWLVTSGPFWLGLITVFIWAYVVSIEGLLISVSSYFLETKPKCGIYWSHTDYQPEETRDPFIFFPCWYGCFAINPFTCQSLWSGKLEPKGVTAMRVLQKRRANYPL